MPSWLLHLILLIVFSIISIVVGFLFTYLIMLSKGKKQIKEHTTFNKDQARSMYIMYKQKNPTDKQIDAMLEAYKKNKS